MLCWHKPHASQRLSPDPNSARSRNQHVRKIVKRFQGGLVFKTHRRLYHSTVGSRVTKKKRKRNRQYLGATCGQFSSYLFRWLCATNDLRKGPMGAMPASECRGDNFQRLSEFELKAKAWIWPCLSCMRRVRSTADPEYSHSGRCGGGGWGCFPKHGRLRAKREPL